MTEEDRDTHREILEIFSKYINVNTIWNKRHSISRAREMRVLLTDLIRAIKQRRVELLESYELATKRPIPPEKMKQYQEHAVKYMAGTRTKSRKNDLDI